jgi:hypothetical protein
VSEDKVMRRIFGREREEAGGGCRRLRNDEFHKLYPSSVIIIMVRKSRMSWVGHVARMGYMRNVYKILVGKPEGKRPRGRRRSRWKDNIRMDLRGLE